MSNWQNILEKHYSGKYEYRAPTEEDIWRRQQKQKSELLWKQYQHDLEFIEKYSHLFPTINV